MKFLNRVTDMMWHGRWHGWAHFKVDENLINELSISEGMTVIDIGSGPGRFSIPIARRVGSRGIVYAIDIDQEALDLLSERAAREGLSNIKTIRADVTAGLPIGSSVADLALMANVLHGFIHEGSGDKVVRETYRVLKPNGVLAVIEFKKSLTSMGPPVWLRVEPKMVIEIAETAGFRTVELKDFGQTHYMLKFVKPA